MKCPCGSTDNLVKNGKTRGIQKWECTFCRRERTMKQYGITQDEFITQLEHQGGKCACCGKVLLVGGHLNRDAAVVDHCHDSEVLRGIICQGCNKAIGALGDTADSVREFAKGVESYLDHPAWVHSDYVQEMLPLDLP